MGKVLRGKPESTALEVFMKSSEGLLGCLGKLERQTKRLKESLTIELNVIIAKEARIFEKKILGLQSQVRLN